MTCAFSGLSAGCGGAAAAGVGGVGGHVALVLREDSLGLFDDLGDAERLAADAVVADGIDQVLRPDEQQQLAEVDLRDEHPAVAAQHRLGVGRERVEVAQVGVGDRPALRLQALDRGADRAVGRAPAEDQQVAALRAR